MKAKSWLLLWLVGAGLAGCAGDDDPDDDGIGPVEYDPSCADLGLGGYSSTIEPPETGTHSLDGALGGRNTVMLGTNGTYLAFGTSIGVDAVIVKGGPTASVYRYEAETGFEMGLSAPVDARTGEPYAISRVELCFDYEVAVSVEAAASLKRTLQWAVAKTSPVREALVAPRQVLRVPYTVDVTTPGFVDSDWTVAGKVIIFNPSPFPAEITGIRSEIVAIRAPDAEKLGAPGGGELLNLPLRCPELPFQLAANGTAACDYALYAGEAIAGNVSAEVTTTGAVGAASGLAPFDFAAPAVSLRDECVIVGDDHVGMLGRTCEPRRYTYTLDLGAFGTCGITRTVTNVAQIFTPDTGAILAAVWSVDLTVPPCPPGCTLSQGYWKTHSAYGPAPRDATWDLLPAGADTPFFGGASYHHVMWTPPSGNVYYVLARAYIAATLNVLGGADGSVIAAVLADAGDLLATYSPANVAAWHDAALRDRLLDYADRLERYNNGTFGGVACTMDGTSGD